MNLAALVAHIDSVPLELGEQIERAGMEDLLDADGCALVLAAVGRCRADLADLASQVERRLLSVAGEKTFVVEGFGQVEIKRSVRRTRWRYDELVPQVVARIADDTSVLFDTETGERLPWVQSAHNIAARLRDCFSFSAKVTGLRALGFTPDDWCDEDEAAWSVRLPSRAA